MEKQRTSSFCASASKPIYASDPLPPLPSNSSWAAPLMLSTPDLNSQPFLRHLLQHPPYQNGVPGCMASGHNGRYLSSATTLHSRTSSRHSVSETVVSLSQGRALDRRPKGPSSSSNILWLTPASPCGFWHLFTLAQLFLLLRVFTSTSSPLPMPGKMWDAGHDTVP